MDLFHFDEIIGIKEASQHSHLSERHVRLLLETGKIQGKKIGHDWVTTKQYVDSYIQFDHPRGRKPTHK